MPFNPGKTHLGKEKEEQEDEDISEILKAFPYIGKPQCFDLKSKESITGESSTSASAGQAPPAPPKPVINEEESDRISNSDRESLREACKALFERQQQSATREETTRHRLFPKIQHPRVLFDRSFAARQEPPPPPRILHLNPSSIRPIEEGTAQGTLSDLQMRSRSPSSLTFPTFNQLVQDPGVSVRSEASGFYVVFPRLHNCPHANTVCTCSGYHSAYDQFMNPGPAPRPPTGTRANNLSFTSQATGWPGNNMSNPNLPTQGRTNSGFSIGNQSTLSLSRSNTSDPFMSSGVVKQGMIKYKEEGFGNVLWKTKWVVLRQNTLEFQKSEGGKISFTILLAHVTSVSRFDSIPLCIELVRASNPSAHMNVAIREQPQKTMYMKFDADDELYEWQDGIYTRCPAISGVSAPTNFDHRVHVGFDAQKGGFTGLPPEWERLLTTSALTRDDYLRNPEAVIEVLEFYTDMNNRAANPETYPSVIPTPPGYNSANMQLGHGGLGTGIAPPRPAPPTSYGSASTVQSQTRYNNTPPRSQGGTPAGGLRNAPSSSPSGYASQTSSTYQDDNKISMGTDMRTMMEEEAKRIKESQERDRQKQRQAERDSSEREKREQAEYNASIPQKKIPTAQQELGGYSTSTDPRYNPARAAPSAPSPNSRQGPQGSLRQPVQAQRPAPSAPNGSSVMSPPKAAFAQGTSSSSRDQSPSGQTRNDRQPSPNTRAQERNQSPSTRGPTNPQPSRIPGPVQQPKPLNVSKTNPVPKVEEPKPAPTKTTETRQKEVRMSSMSESEVMAKLKKIVTRMDPNDSYTKQKKIGQGASGSVYIAKVRSDSTSSVAQKVWRKDGVDSRVAIKTMDLRHQPRKELIVNEILVMKESIHPNIVNYLDSFLIENDSELWVIMEYMSGGSLTDVIDNNTLITEDQIAAVCNEVSLCLWLSFTSD